MNLLQVVKHLQGIALTIPNIRSANEGSVYQIQNGNPHQKYMSFVISQTQHRTDDLFDYFGLNLFLIDRLTDELEEANRLQIQSLAKDCLTNILIKFCNKFYGATYNELVFHPFTEKFVDLCAGQYVQVTLQIPRNIICEDEYATEYLPDYVLKPLVVEITENGVYEYEPTDFDGYNKVTVTVNVDIPDNYGEGFESGVTYQKSLLTSTAFTENGVYSTENGYGEVTVNVPQTSTTINNQTKTVEVMENGDYVVEFDEGYTGLDKVNFNVEVSGYTQDDLDDAYESGITYQKSLLEDIVITHNGEYLNENGYSAITVNVPQSGESIYNQSKILEISGNGSYIITYDEGYTGLEAVNITVNVPQSAYTSGYTEQDLIDAYNRGYEDGLNDCGGDTSGDTSGDTEDYNSKYLTFESISKGSIIWHNNYNTEVEGKVIYYSINEGNWIPISSNYNVTSANTITVNKGDKIRFKGNNLTYSYNVVNQAEFNFRNGVQVKIYGNIMSLIYGDNFIGQTTLTKDRTFEAIFGKIAYKVPNIIDVSNLVLPATTLTKDCYEYMFYNCTNIKKAPVLPATTLTNLCYNSMFYGCTSLNYIKCLATDFTANGCINSWLYDVSETGTFVKKSGASWPTGESGIPSGWTIQNI